MNTDMVSIPPSIIPRSWARADVATRTIAAAIAILRQVRWCCLMTLTSYLHRGEQTRIGYSLPQNSIVLPTQRPLGRTLTLSGGSRHRSRPAASPRAAIPAHIVWGRLKKVR